MKEKISDSVTRTLAEMRQELSKLPVLKTPQAPPSKPTFELDEKVAVAVNQTFWEHPPVNAEAQKKIIDEVSKFISEHRQELL